MLHLFWLLWILLIHVPDCFLQEVTVIYMRGNDLPPLCKTKTNQNGICLSVQACVHESGNIIGSCKKHNSFGVCCHTAESDDEVESFESTTPTSDYYYYDEEASTSIPKPHPSPTKKQEASISIPKPHPSPTKKHSPPFYSGYINVPKTDDESVQSSTTPNINVSEVTVLHSSIPDVRKKLFIDLYVRLKTEFPKNKEAYIMALGVKNLLAGMNITVPDVGNNSSEEINSEIEDDNVTSSFELTDCGRTPLIVNPRELRHGKIMGGLPALKGEFPWQVSLREVRGFTSIHQCGATLIHPRWILTAAHCAAAISVRRMVVRIGSNKLDSPNVIDSTVRRKIMHPDFDMNSYDNDIALLELNNDLPLLPNIQPICLPPNIDVVGRRVIMTGWGKLESAGQLPDTLMKVRAPVISNKECEKWYKNASHEQVIEDKFICIGYAAGGRDACDGDSGGPVQIQLGLKWYIVAIISWGLNYTCGKAKMPGASVLVNTYTEWIKNNTRHEVKVLPP